MITVQGNSKRNYDFTGVDYHYKYQSGLNLKPGSDLHDSIVSNLITYARTSYDVMKRRHPYWRSIDHTLTAYITLSDKEKIEKSKDEKDNKPVAVVVPYSYAALETILSYMVTAFFDMPIFKYNPFSSEDVIGVAILEKIIEAQCLRNSVALNLHTQFRDSFVYGFGVSSPYWREEFGSVTIFDASGSKSRIKKMLFEGNALINIDPYKYLPDPSVPIHDPQRGSFCGWFNSTNYTELMSLEQYDDRSFNAQYVKHIDGRSSILEESAGRETKFGGESRLASNDDIVSPVDELVMIVNLIPQEWKLGKEKYPEKWLFRLAGDSILLEASKLDLDHNQYPITVAAPNYDGYSLMPVSSLEIVYGLQEILDFLFTSHVANIRKAINDMLIVDPYLINMDDLRKPGPGKLIRTRRAVWGRGVENAVKQLAVADVTRSHMNDAEVVMDVAQRSTGAVDSLMGIMRGGSERRSATESRFTNSGAVSRLAKAARIISLMTMHPMAYQFASNTQQFLDSDTYISIIGRYQQELEEEFGVSYGMKVSPNDVLVNYDIVISDGTVDRGDYVETWQQIFNTVAANPAVGAGFDVVRIFKHLARMTGAKNLNEFVKKGGGATITTMQNEEVEAEVQKGNMVPIS
jgi:hypothetical protein